jgi:hypothetical protein
MTVLGELPTQAGVIEEIKGVLSERNPALNITQIEVMNITATTANIVSKSNSVIYSGSVAITFFLKTNIATLRGDIQNVVQEVTDSVIIFEFLSLNGISTNLSSTFYVSYKDPATATINAYPTANLYYGTKIVTYSPVPYLGQLVSSTDAGYVTYNTFDEIIAGVRRANPTFAVADSELYMEYTTDLTGILRAVTGSTSCRGFVNLT